MLVVKSRTIAAALMVCGLLCGCTTAGPNAEPAPVAAAMSQAEMESLAAQAEQAIARGDYPNAIALFQRVVAAYPRSAAAWFRLGIVHLRINDARLAQYNFERALQADPTLTKAHANLALAHLKQFRLSAERSVASDQINEDNRAILRSLIRDVDHALYAPATLPATVQR